MSYRLRLVGGTVAAVALCLAGSGAVGALPVTHVFAQAPSQPGNSGGGQAHRPDATPTATPGRPENAGRSASAPAGRPDATGTAQANGRGPSHAPPQLPPQASARARAAVAATAQLHDRIAARIQAIRDLPQGADRQAAMDQLMTDFGDMYHLVSDAVHAAPAGNGNATATSEASGTATPTAAPTDTPTPTPTT